MWQRDSRDRTTLQPTPAAAIDVSQLPLFINIILAIWKNMLTGGMMMVLSLLSTWYISPYNKIFNLC
jgi:hypothetical protein